jgi:hypothetical protein
MAERRFEITPRASELGGGWNLRFLEQQPDGSDIEMGGGVFPVTEGMTEQDTYADAYETGLNWIGPEAYIDRSETENSTDATGSPMLL